MNSDPASLDNLHDVVTAPPVTWWPPAAGWFWLLALVLVVTTAFALRWFAVWQENRYRREALALLSQQLADVKERSAAVATMAEVVKRTAMTAFSREAAASLTGDAWLQFLDRTGRTQAFTQGAGRWLEISTFDLKSSSKLGDDEFRELAKTVENWLKHHQPEAAKEGAC